MASAQDLRTEMLIKLMMNSLEPMAEKAARAGFSPMNFHAFKTGLLGQLANFLANNESLLTFFETGLEGAVLLLFPSMPNAYKVALHDLLDMATDGLRQSLREKDDKKAELKISETNSNFKKGM
ncbi:hypothetical protein KKE33_02695, partial [Patescibacteria group bacterium]|nr:hypothetical protein [Patescibacteria group bacterium]